MIAWRYARSWREPNAALGCRIVEAQGDDQAELAHAVAALLESALASGALTLTVDRWGGSGGYVASVYAAWRVPAGRR